MDTSSSPSSHFYVRLAPQPPSSSSSSSSLELTTAAVASAPITSIHLNDVLLSTEMLMRCPPPLENTVVEAKSDATDAAAVDDAVVAAPSCLHVWDYLTSADRAMLEDKHGFLFTETVERMYVNKDGKGKAREAQDSGDAKQEENAKETASPFSNPTTASATCSSHPLPSDPQPTATTAALSSSATTLSTLIRKPFAFLFGMPGGGDGTTKEGRGGGKLHSSSRRCSDGGDGDEGEEILLAIEGPPAKQEEGHHHHIPAQEEKKKGCRVDGGGEDHDGNACTPIGQFAPQRGGMHGTARGNGGGAGKKTDDGASSSSPFDLMMDEATPALLGDIATPGRWEQYHFERSLRFGGTDKGEENDDEGEELLHRDTDTASFASGNDDEDDDDAEDDASQYEAFVDHAAEAFPHLPPALTDFLYDKYAAMKRRERRREARRKKKQDEGEEGRECNNKGQKGKACHSKATATATAAGGGGGAHSIPIPATVLRRRLQCLVIPKGYFLTMDIEVAAAASTSTLSSSEDDGMEVCGDVAYSSPPPLSSKIKSALSVTMPPPIMRPLETRGEEIGDDGAGMGNDVNAVGVVPQQATVSIDGGDCVFVTVSIRKLANVVADSPSSNASTDNDSDEESGTHELHRRHQPRSQGRNQHNWSVSRPTQPDANPNNPNLSSLRWLNILGIDGLTKGSSDSFPSSSSLPPQPHATRGSTHNTNTNPTTNNNTSGSSSSVVVATFEVTCRVSEVFCMPATSSSSSSSLSSSSEGGGGMLSFPLHFNDVCGMEMDAQQQGDGDDDDDDDASSSSTTASLSMDASSPEGKKKKSDNESDTPHHHGTPVLNDAELFGSQTTQEEEEDDGVTADAERTMKRPHKDNHKKTKRRSNRSVDPATVIGEAKGSGVPAAQQQQQNAPATALSPLTPPSSPFAFTVALTRLSPFILRPELFARPFSHPLFTTQCPNALPAAGRVKQSFRQWARSEQARRDAEAVLWGKRLSWMVAHTDGGSSHGGSGHDDDERMTAGVNAYEGGGGERYDCEASAAFHALRKEASSKWRTVATLRVVVGCNTLLPRPSPPLKTTTPQPPPLRSSAVVSSSSATSSSVCRDPWRSLVLSLLPTPTTPQQFLSARERATLLGSGDAMPSSPFSFSSSSSSSTLLFTMSTLLPLLLSHQQRSLRLADGREGGSALLGGSRARSGTDDTGVGSIFIGGGAGVGVAASSLCRSPTVRSATDGPPSEFVLLKQAKAEEQQQAKEDLEEAEQLKEEENQQQGGGAKEDDDCCRVQHYHAAPVVAVEEITREVEDEDNANDAYDGDEVELLSPAGDAACREGMAMADASRQMEAVGASQIKHHTTESCCESDDDHNDDHAGDNDNESNGSNSNTHYASCNSKAAPSPPLLKTPFVAASPLISGGPSADDDDTGDHAHVASTSGEAAAPTRTVAADESVVVVGGNKNNAAHDDAMNRTLPFVSQSPPFTVGDEHHGGGDADDGDGNIHHQEEKEGESVPFRFENAAAQQKDSVVIRRDESDAFQFEFSDDIRRRCGEAAQHLGATSTFLHLFKKNDDAAVCHDDDRCGDEDAAAAHIVESSFAFELSPSSSSYYYRSGDGCTNHLQVPATDALNAAVANADDDDDAPTQHTPHATVVAITIASVRGDEDDDDNDKACPRTALDVHNADGDNNGAKVLTNAIVVLAATTASDAADTTLAAGGGGSAVFASSPADATHDTHTYAKNNADQPPPPPSFTVAAPSPPFMNVLLAPPPPPPSCGIGMVMEMGKMDCSLLALKAAVNAHANSSNKDHVGGGGNDCDDPLEALRACEAMLRNYHTAEHSPPSSSAPSAKVNAGMHPPLPTREQKKKQVTAAAPLIAPNIFLLPPYSAAISSEEKVVTGNISVMSESGGAAICFDDELSMTPPRLTPETHQKRRRREDDDEEEEEGNTVERGGAAMAFTKLSSGQHHTHHKEMVAGAAASTFSSFITPLRKGKAAGSRKWRTDNTNLFSKSNHHTFDFATVAKPFQLPSNYAAPSFVVNTCTVANSARPPQENGDTLGGGGGGGDDAEKEEEDKSQDELPSPIRAAPSNNNTNNGTNAHTDDPLEVLPREAVVLDKKEAALVVVVNSAVGIIHAEPRRTQDSVEDERMGPNADVVGEDEGAHRGDAQHGGVAAAGGTQEMGTKDGSSPIDGEGIVDNDDAAHNNDSSNKWVAAVGGGDDSGEGRGEGEPPTEAKMRRFNSALNGVLPPPLNANTALATTAEGGADVKGGQKGGSSSAKKKNEVVITDWLRSSGGGSTLSVVVKADNVNDHPTSMALAVATSERCRQGAQEKGGAMTAKETTHSFNVSNTSKMTHTSNTANSGNVSDHSPIDSVEKKHQHQQQISRRPSFRPTALLNTTMSSSGGGGGKEKGIGATNTAANYDTNNNYSNVVRRLDMNSAGGKRSGMPLCRQGGHADDHHHHHTHRGNDDDASSLSLEALLGLGGDGGEEANGRDDHRGSALGRKRSRDEQQQQSPQHDNNSIYDKSNSTNSALPRKGNARRGEQQKQEHDAHWSTRFPRVRLTDTSLAPPPPISHHRLLGRNPFPQPPPLPSGRDADGNDDDGRTTRSNARQQQGSLMAMAFPSDPSAFASHQQPIVIASRGNTKNYNDVSGNNNIVDNSKRATVRYRGGFTQHVGTSSLSCVTRRRGGRGGGGGVYGDNLHNNHGMGAAASSIRYPRFNGTFVSSPFDPATPSSFPSLSSSSPFAALQQYSAQRLALKQKKGLIAEDANADHHHSSSDWSIRKDDRYNPNAEVASEVNSRFARDAMATRGGEGGGEAEGDGCGMNPIENADGDYYFGEEAFTAAEGEEKSGRDGSSRRRVDLKDKKVSPLSHRENQFPLPVVTVDAPPKHHATTVRRAPSPSSSAPHASPSAALSNTAAKRRSGLTATQRYFPTTTTTTTAEAVRQQGGGGKEGMAVAAAGAAATREGRGVASHIPKEIPKESPQTTVKRRNASMEEEGEAERMKKQSSRGRSTTAPPLRQGDTAADAGVGHHDDDDDDHRRRSPLSSSLVRTAPKRLRSSSSYSTATATAQLLSSARMMDDPSPPSPSFIDVSTEEEGWERALLGSMPQKKRLLFEEEGAGGRRRRGGRQRPLTTDTYHHVSSSSGSGSSRRETAEAAERITCELMAFLTKAKERQTQRQFTATSAAQRHRADQRERDPSATATTTTILGIDIGGDGGSAEGPIPISSSTFSNISCNCSDRVNASSRLAAATVAALNERNGEEREGMQARHDRHQGLDAAATNANSVCYHTESAATSFSPSSHPQFSHTHCNQQQSAAMPSPPPLVHHNCQPPFSYPQSQFNNSHHQPSQSYCCISPPFPPCYCCHGATVSPQHAAVAYSYAPLPLPSSSSPSFCHISSSQHPTPHPWPCSHPHSYYKPPCCEHQQQQHQYQQHYHQQQCVSAF